MEAQDKLTMIGMLCVDAILTGQPTVTISVTGGKRPKGFPRGELLSVGTNGAHNYAINPVRLMKWVHDLKLAATPQSGG